MSVTLSYNLYHETMGQAIDQIKQAMFESGSSSNDLEKEIFSTVAYGETSSFTFLVDCIKGQPVKNTFLNIQLYRMQSGKYELNAYVL